MLAMSQVARLWLEAPSPVKSAAWSEFSGWHTSCATVKMLLSLNGSQWATLNNHDLSLVDLRELPWLMIDGPQWATLNNHDWWLMDLRELPWKTMIYHWWTSVSYHDWWLMDLHELPWIIIDGSPWATLKNHDLSLTDLRDLSWTTMIYHWWTSVIYNDLSLMDLRDLSWTTMIYHWWTSVIHNDLSLMDLHDLSWTTMIYHWWTSVIYNDLSLMDLRDLSWTTMIYHLWTSVSYLELQWFIIGPTWLSFSWGNLGYPVHVTGHTKKLSIKGKTGHCSALPQLESDGLSWGTLSHPQWPIKEKSDPPGRPGGTINFGHWWTSMIYDGQLSSIIEVQWSTMIYHWSSMIHNDCDTDQAVDKWDSKIELKVVHSNKSKRTQWDIWNTTYFIITPGFIMNTVH